MSLDYALLDDDAVVVARFDTLKAMLDAHTPAFLPAQLVSPGLARVVDEHGGWISDFIPVTFNQQQHET